MDLLEYQGKQLFARHGVPVPAGAPATTVEEAVAAADEIGYPCVDQGAGADRRPRQGRRHQGRQGPRRGRGARQGDPRHGHPRPHRARGVGRGGVGHRRRVLRVDRLRPRGQEAAGDALDAGRHGHRGGRRAATPTRSPACTSTRCSASRTSTPAGSRSRPASTPTSCARSARCSTKLYDAFVAEEAMLVEVNPLIVTADREVMALDAKVTLDDNSLFRHPDNAELRDAERRGPAGADGQGARADLRQARRQRRHPRQRRRARDVARSTSSPRPAASRRTSSTPAAARRPRRSRRRSR